jgi:hypothetical protein
MGFGFTTFGLAVQKFLKCFHLRNLSKIWYKFDGFDFVCEKERERERERETYLMHTKVPYIHKVNEEVLSVSAN